MRERIKTSLLSLICGSAVSVAALAAPTVRTIGGDGTYTSAAAATTTAARSGSLRSTGSGGLRPSISATTTGGTAATGSVSSGGTLTNRASSTPRLSIGKYIGTPKSISTTPSGTGDSEALSQRIDELESDIKDKQGKLSGDDYIHVDGNDVTLDVDALADALSDVIGDKGRDGDDREIEIVTDDDGLYWRFTDEEEGVKHLVIEWSELREKLNIDAIQTSITNVNTAITNAISDIDGKLATKLDKQYDLTETPDAAGKALVVDSNGNIVPTGAFVESKWTDAENPDNVKNKVLVTDADGNVKLSTNSLNPDDFGEMAYLDESDLGALAWEDSVTTGFIADDAVTTEKIANSAVARAKLADDISKVISWMEWWKKNAPGDIEIGPDGKMTGDGMQYVLSVDSYGNAQWFRVITPDNADATQLEPTTPTPSEPTPSEPTPSEP